MTDVIQAYLDPNPTVPTDDRCGTCLGIAEPDRFDPPYTEEDHVKRHNRPDGSCGLRRTFPLPEADCPCPWRPA